MSKKLLSHMTDEALLHTFARYFTVPRSQYTLAEIRAEILRRMGEK